jgi:mono/diheme cytochrome c family protein
VSNKQWLWCGAIVAGVIFPGSFLGVRAQTSPSSKVGFVKDIQPIFERSCYSCHGSKLQMGGLRLDAKKLAFEGGQSGKVIHPGNSRESSLYRRVAGIGDQARMPMGMKPLVPAEIAAVKNWIDQGA